MQRQDEILSDTLTVSKETIFDSISVGRIGIASRSESAHSDTKVERKTLFFDCLRYVFQGALDKELGTALLLMAIQTLGASVNYKVSLTLLTSIGFIGMIFTPITQQLANRSRWNSMQVSALYFTLMGIAFCCAAFATSWVMFFTLMALARICDKQQIPLMIDIYCDNYPKARRGFKVGTALACMPIGGIIFAQCMERFWNKNPNHFCYALLLASLLALFCAICFLKIPARKVVATQYPPLWDNFKWIARDRLFAAILFLYSLIAIANQMTLPLRVEYLANHKHGLNLSYGTILAIFAVIQPLAGVLSGPLWGKLYDHVNLITMRQCVTICLLIGIPLFFATHDLRMICLASVLLGIGRSGGVIFWSLWVSDIAPREKVGEYMSANTAVMGLRDALAPLLGYVLLEYLGPWAVGVTAFVLLVFSLIGFEYLQRPLALRKCILDFEK
ncbi:MAG: MFS transporter [Puniceicoccales bacterium]|jgi:MFS family permease|nr:MFS transporter [Puniceicoccales bacterium]